MWWKSFFAEMVWSKSEIQRIHRAWQARWTGKVGNSNKSGNEWEWEQELRNNSRRERKH